jgi:hypothetical protein
MKTGRFDQTFKSRDTYKMDGDVTHIYFPFIKKKKCSEKEETWSTKNWRHANLMLWLYYLKISYWHSARVNCFSLRCDSLQDPHRNGLPGYATFGLYYTSRGHSR